MIKLFKKNNNTKLYTVWKKQKIVYYAINCILFHMNDNFQKTI